MKILKEYAEALIIALILAMIIRGFFFQAFKIPSTSMVETLLVGDHLLVSKIAYGLDIPFTQKSIVRWSDPKHGDIIVFEYPKDTSKDYIKRVIGVPGDTLEIRNQKIIRNGEVLDEPYARHSGTFSNDPRRDNLGPVTIPDNKYFVMGDNRDDSADSRYWGYVDRKLVIGKAWIIYWSWNGLMDIRWSRIADKIR